jgi:hypothetical protein
MRRLLFAFCLVVFTTSLLSAQTRLMVIGSVHSPTKYITQDTLFNVLTRFKADVVLLELDSSLMDDKGNFKRPPQAISLEPAAAQRYRDASNNVQLGRIDVVYRNQFYKAHNTFAKERLLSRAVDSLYKNNLLNDTTWFTVNSLYSATQILNNFANMRLKDINAADCMQAASLRQHLLYKREVDVIRNNSALNGWYDFAKENADFWDLRNKTMVNNILNYIKQHRGKNIAVIVGYYHKYALIDGLKPLARSKKFELVE